MKRFSLPVFVTASLAAFLLGQTPAQPAPLAAGLPTEIEALLINRCAECHGAKAPKGGLNLLTPASLAHGGRKGTAVRPGKPDDSLLWKRVESGEMPPSRPLPPTERL